MNRGIERRVDALGSDRNIDCAKMRNKPRKERAQRQAAKNFHKQHGSRELAQQELAQHEQSVQISVSVAATLS